MVTVLFGEKNKLAPDEFLMMRKIDKAGNIREVGRPCGVQPTLWQKNSQVCVGGSRAVC